MARIRLVFEDHHLLDKSQRSEGYCRSWFFLKPDITNIGDLESQIRECFGLRHRIVLLIDDFTLPSFESICAIKDKDIIMVKKKDSKQKDSKHLDSKMMQPQPMDQQHMQNQAIPVPQQQWTMMQSAPHSPHAQYQQAQPPTIWNQQPSQIPPPALVSAPRQHQLPPQHMSHYAPQQTGGMTPGERRGDDGSDYMIFVGDLASDVTESLLQETFKTHYSSVKGAKVVTDRATGRSKGYGFVKFGDLNEQSRAMTEMNGAFCSSRPMRIGPASNKNNAGIQQQNPTNASYQSQQGTDSENDPNNTTIFVRGLDSSVSDDLLQQLFSPYGELVYVKIPAGKRYGFVQFAKRGNAEEALQMLNGFPLGGQIIQLSWGRTPNKQSY